MADELDLPGLQTELVMLKAKVAQLETALAVYSPANKHSTKPPTTRRKMLGKLAAGLLFGIGATVAATSSAEAKFYGKQYTGTICTSPSVALSGQLPFGGYGLLGITSGVSAANLANFSLATDYNFGLGGFAYAPSGNSYAGVVGEASFGVIGKTTYDSTTGKAIYGISTLANAYAGYFEGKVQVVGAFSATSKNFKIDHPLDPANKYLYHTSIESAERLNLYSGNITLDDAGTGTIEFPDWFAALNQDFRYQLTSVGAACPTLHVLPLKDGASFQIAGGTIGLQVSWVVTGVRHDRWAEQHPTVVEEQKPENERGKYLHPALYGQSLEKSVSYAAPK